MLSYTPKSMRCNSWASFLARTLASPGLGCDPKVRVAIVAIVAKSTTKDFNFKQAPIKASSVRGCISLLAQNGLLELETVIMVLSVQL
jgi:hypothetical protein